VVNGLDKKKQERADETVKDKGKQQTESVPADASAEQLPQTEDLQEQLAEAQKALEAARAQAEDFKRKWYSVTAEYDNYRKRTAGTRTQAYAEGRSDVVSKLFPIADNLGRALESCADENTKKGIAMVTASFEKLLEEEKIETIDPVGEEFSAETCEAIMAVEPQEGETSGTVKQVFRKGYRQNGKILRFAQVSVIR